MKATFYREWLKTCFTRDTRRPARKNRPGLGLELMECRTVPAGLDLSGGQVIFTGASGINDALSVTQASGLYTVTDGAEPIALTPAAVSAGWTGSGTNAVTGPAAGVTLLDFNLAGGSDTLGTVAAGSAGVTATGAGNLDIAGLVSTTGAVTISGVTNLTDATGHGEVQGAPVVLSAAGGIGAPGANVIVAVANPAVAVSVSSGPGGVFLTTTAGATVTAAASGAGNVSITNTTGTLTVAPGGIDATGATVTGNVSLSSGGAVALNGNIGSGVFAGTISVAADTTGTITSTSADAYEQNGQFLTTTNTTAAAATITVNTPTAGVGQADLGQGTIGGVGGGTITVTAYGGNIAWSTASALKSWSSTAPQTGITGAGSNSAVLAASNYVFTTTGAGAIGTDARPIQAASYSAVQVQRNPNPDRGSATLSAGSGGIYFVDWGPAGTENNALTLNSAIATGGGIRVVTAAATGHALWVDGQVWTKSGSIQLYSDDNITLDGATIGGPYRGVAYSGSIDIEANRDAANGQTLSMRNGSTIDTTAAHGTVINLTAAPSTGGTDVIDTQIPSGGIDLENVTCGNGGTIAVNAAADAAAEGVESNQQGSIIQQSGEINAGPTGTVILTARAYDTTNETPVGSIGVGVIGNQARTGTPWDTVQLFPVTIAAGTIKATTTGTSLPGSGGINVVALDPATVTVLSSANPTASAYYSDNPASDISIQGESTTGPLTVAAVATGPGSGSAAEDGGSVTLTDAAGVVVSGMLGSATTGAVTVNGPLSGSGNIVLGTDKLLVTQSASSVFAGTISGPHSVTVGGGGTLTLTGTEGYSLGTTIEPGTTLLVDGSIAESNGVTVDAGAVLGGDGTVGNVTLAGTLAPGTAAGPGILKTGSLTFTSGSSFDVELNGTTAGSGFSQVIASGPVTLTDVTLDLSIGPDLVLTQPESFDILVNSSGQPVNGTFAGLAEGAVGTTSAGQEFDITYLGGVDVDDVVVTVFPRRR